MTEQAHQQGFAQRMERATALMDALHANKGSINPGDAYARLRELYASGRISLEEFEARVSTLLRRAR